MWSPHTVKHKIEWCQRQFTKHINGVCGMAFAIWSTWSTSF